MSDLLPLFPLPNVVLFPQVFLPLHVFEPRYRAMVADALAGDRVIGMVLLKPGWEADYDGCPAVYSTGCSGVITHCERLPDGRYNLVLRGLERFCLLGEDRTRRYRRGQVRALPTPPLDDASRRALREARHRLESMIAPAVGSEELKGHASMSDEDLINALSQYLDFEPLEKQALLECACLRSRAEALIELLDMRLLLRRTPGATRTAH